MIPALSMGIVISAYISILFVILECYVALFSPLIGLIGFIILLLALKADKVKALTTFYIGSVIAAFEIYVHTYYLGYSTGFGLFLFVLPPVALLKPTWNNASLSIYLIINAAAIVTLYYVFSGVDNKFNITDQTSDIIFALNTAGASVVVLVVLLYFNNAVTHRDQQLINANLALAKKNAQQEILLKEIHHRVKNNLQVISSMMSLQKNTLNDVQAIRALGDSQNRIRSMALIHNKLYEDKNVSRVDFKSYLNDLIKFHSDINSDVKTKIVAQEIELELDIAVPMGLVVSELLMNAYKHAFDNSNNGLVEIQLNKNESSIEAIIKDNGKGLPDNFKIIGSNTLGCEIIEALLDQIDGRVEFWNDNGANFKLIIGTKKVPSMSQRLSNNVVLSN